MLRILFFSVLILFAASNCRSKPEIKPTQASNSSAVVFEVKHKMPFQMFGNPSFTEIWIIKVDEKAKSYANMELIKANYLSGSRFYLLNIVPGNYVVAAGKRFQKGGDAQPSINHWIVFDKPSMDKSKFTVRPGELANLGEFTIDASSVPPDQDPSLLQIGEKIFPGFGDSITKKVIGAIGVALFGGTADAPSIGLISEHNKTPEKIEEIKKEAKEDFEETEWASLVK
jgi:hypothetical protein